MQKIIQIASVFLSLSLLSGCQFSNVKQSNSALSDGTGEVSPLVIDSGTVITDNQQAFEEKLALINQATKSIDLVYFIFSDDYSSSVLASHLIAASQRGVKVRLLVDYVTNYSRLDWFSMLEAEGGGNLSVRFYGRPTYNMIKDAVYMTLGCNDSAPRADKSACSKEKLAKIERIFQSEKIEGVSAESLNISNINLAESGLFLSGFYGKNTDAMTLAIEQGQKIFIDRMSLKGNEGRFSQAKQFKHLGKLYWKSRTGPAYKRVFNRIKTALAFQHYGDALNPVYASFSQFLPIERQNIGEAARDWDFFTDYAHHKLLLVDNQSFILGGRNIEDAYHMHPNSLSAKYTFMDTDLTIHLSEPNRKMQHRFEALWSFVRTASLSDVRQHAPNDFIANWYWANDACLEAFQLKGCRTNWLHRVNLSLQARIDLEKTKLEENQETYQAEYQPSSTFAKGFPSFSVAPMAIGTYLENLAYRATDANQQRQFGARNHQTLRSNKNIHAYWLKKLKEQCSVKDKSPREVYFYNAYFFPPPNMMLAFKALIDGSNDCRHVTLNIITNSVDSTDLVPVNILASHSLKAFADFYTKQFNKNRSATIRYFEYQKTEDKPLSLHSKVTLFNDALVIGSANLDVRSYFMDTNNALVIEDDSELINQYQQYLEARINSPDLLKLKNVELSSKTFEMMAVNDRQLLQASLDKYAVQNRLSKTQHQALIQKMEELTTAAYQLTKRLLESDSSLEQQRISERFYQLFKTI
ncbi:MAG: phospholipase D-like domain-containing protein [Thiomicrorhabdus sp.]|nr:phospholipase D-like domain-containing protein [Thiomicrorhabdus sp.]